MSTKPWIAGAVVWCSTWCIAWAAEKGASFPAPTNAAASGSAAVTSPEGPGDPLAPLRDWAKQRLEELDKSQPEVDLKLSELQRTRETKSDDIRKVIAEVDMSRDPECVRLSRAVADLQQQEQALNARRKQLGKITDNDLRKGFQLRTAELRRQLDETSRAKADREFAYAVQVRPALAKLQQQVEEIDAKARALRDPREADRRKAQQYLDQYTPRTVEAIDVQKERVLVVPPVADATARQQRFAARHSPAAVGALAQRLRAYLDLSAPDLLSMKLLADQNKHADFLAAYRNYFITKLRNPAGHGTPEDAFPRAMLVRRELPQAWLDDAKRGIFREARGGEMLRVDVGMPGSMQWCYISDDYIGPNLENWLIEFYRAFGRPAVVNGLGVRTLLDGYLATGDPSYLQQWCAVMDDWCLNWRDDVERCPDNIRSYDVQAPRDLTLLLAQLRVALSMYETSVEDFPPTTLARVLLLALEEYNAANLRAKRSMINGGTARGLADVVRNSVILPEFRPSQWALAEVKKSAEREYVLTMAPDGGPRDFSDASRPGPWAEAYASILWLLEKSHVGWCNETWLREFQESYRRNLRFFLRNLKPDGRRIIADYRGLGNLVQGDETDPPTFTNIDAQSPKLLEEPEAARLIDTVFGTGSAGVPQHLDDAMPYHVSFNQRRTWEKDDLFLYMRAPRLNCNPDEDVCGLKLFGFGQLMLNAPPIYVDGVSQNSHYGLVENPGGPATFLVFDDGRVGKGLWHSSLQFGLLEGIYEGSYEETGNRPYWSPFQGSGGDIPVQHAGERAITNVSRHSRQVFFLRPQGVWIVVDRMQSNATHSYQQHYQLYAPLRKVDWFFRKLIPITKNAPRVTSNQEQGLIMAQSPGLPSTTICQVASAPLRYEFRHGEGIANHDFSKLPPEAIEAAEIEWRSAGRKMGGMMAFNRQVTTSIKGQGPQVLVSAIQARENGSTGDLKGVRRVTGQEGPIGFRFDGPDGSRVAFQTTTSKALEIRSGSISVVGESLLTVAPAKTGSAVRGMVTGCTSFVTDGRPQKVGTPDFEFVVGSDAQGPTFAMVPCFRPIQPVTISPETAVFADKLQVELACATPGVEIHYTLDDTEPKPSSPRYAAPITITQTCQVRAIALRPGLKEIPWGIEGTRVTLPTWAFFTRQLPKSPQSAPSESLVPGLSYEYFEGNGFELFSACDQKEPLRKGSTKQLFDVSMRQTGSEFAVRYRGFLKIPSTGVYTFYAPREFWYPAIDSGYDLRVAIDGESWYPSTRRHALGTWSTSLSAGLHKFECTFIDFRRKDGKVETWHDFPIPEAQWKGVAPELIIAGPDLKKQSLPVAWLVHEPQPAWVDKRLEQRALAIRRGADAYEGLVAHWDFQKSLDGKVLDVSGHGFDARLSGGTLVEGPRGKAFRFAKTDAGLIVEKASRLLDGDRDFTLVFRARIADDSTGFLLQKSRRWKQDGWGWSAQGRFVAFKSSMTADIPMQPPLDAEPWRCLVLIYRVEDRAVRIYNQGKLAGSGTLKSLPAVNDAPWKMANNLTGDLDGVWIYGRAFARDEVFRITEELTAKTRSPNPKPASSPR